MRRQVHAVPSLFLNYICSSLHIYFWKQSIHRVVKQNSSTTPSHICFFSHHWNDTMSGITTGMIPCQHDHFLDHAVHRVLQTFVKKNLFVHIWLKRYTLRFIVYKDSHLPLRLFTDHVPSLLFGKLKVNGEEKGLWSLSSATTTTEPSTPSSWQNVSSLGIVGMLSFSSSTQMTTVPVADLEPETQQHYWFSRSHVDMLAHRNNGIHHFHYNNAVSPKCKF